MGPQGNGLDLNDLGQGQKALIIGGGIGVPPLVQVAKQLTQQGVEVEVVVGFATKGRHFGRRTFSGGSCHCMTDDKFYGTKGYVSTVIDQMWSRV